MADKPGDKVTHSDHNAAEKAGSPEIQKARNPNANEVAQATKPHLGDGSLRRFNQDHLDSQNASIEIDFGGQVASREKPLTERQATRSKAQEQGHEAHAKGSDAHGHGREIHLSQPVRPENILHLVDVTLSTTARLLEMPILHLAENNAINKDIANFIEHFRHDPDQFNKDVKKVGGEVLGIINKPMSEEERARLIGVLIPLFFMPGQKAPLSLKEVQAMELETMTEAQLAEKGITRRVVEVYRGDNHAYEAVNDMGLGKSHLNAEGDLVPADPKGIYNDVPVDIVEHINPSLSLDAKGHSPYTSFSESSDFASVNYGKTHITLDLHALRNDIANGVIKDVEIIDRADMPAHIARSRLGKVMKDWALECARSEHEVLVKGIIPKKYLKVEVK